MIDVSDLAYDFSSNPVLQDLTFLISSGESVAVVGPNGAGKTTFLRCLAGILPVSQGHISLKGKELSSYAKKEYARMVAYVPQIVGNLPPYSVREFVSMARYPYEGAFRIFSRREARRIEEVLSATHLHHLAARTVSTLSGGERQRVLLAAALCQEPELLLLDEPAAFLDPNHEEVLYQALSDFQKKDGLTSIIVSHDINRAALSCGRILALAEGRIRFDGAAQEFMQGDALRELFGIDFTLRPHPDTEVNMILPSIMTNE